MRILFMDETTHAAADGEPVGRFRLDGLRVDVATGRIVGPGGSERVDPKVMQVLEALVIAAGGVVTRTELLDRIWHDRVVTEDVVSRCIYQLRRHLVLAGGDQRFRRLIETLPRRGYRLRVKPEPLAENDLDEPRGRPTRLAAMILVLLSVAAAWWFNPWYGGLPSGDEIPADRDAIVVVLPFADLSAAGDKGYLADGITEELINVLAGLPELRVIARTSSFSFKGQFPDIATVASTLNVTHVLEGSVRSSGNRIRVTAQLIDAGNSSHLWSETFERELGDIFIIQDDIARSVASALEISLAGDMEAREPRLTDPRAYARNVEARFLLHRRETGDLLQAQALFREAVELDPDMVEAWAGLAGAYYLLAAHGEMPEAQALEQMRSAAERAIALDPEHPEAYSRLAQWYYYKGEVDTARELFDKAVARGRNNALILGNLAGMAKARNDLDQAVSLMREALAIDPLSAVNRFNLANLLIMNGQFAEARELIEQSLRLLQGERVQQILHHMLGRLHLLEGDPQAALALSRELGDTAEADWLEAMARVVIDGTLPDAEVVARLQAASMDLPELRLAELYAFAGLPNPAFEWLQRGYRLREEGYLARREYISFALASEFLRPLGTDPRWDEWLAVATSRGTTTTAD
ncbi:tetratricopeptide repeat protein [Wenzhouxiangella sp. XN201]|uniref:winged helix-turn-helix domain-containing tetratricopeptide repeat protein n=1 Tax=Wenzhouxiangella sp. XN201 TaxID=2710755 RepID=UPI0013CD6886|nr:tetratricopeptide repeat protein [Wenzhouxiangella sp. XN201]NEZ03113.1 tetratricopeptide repeat protein [Wenzhouxiangella sp. XN201]